MIREIHEMASSTASRKFRFDSFATEFATPASVKSEQEDRPPKSDICDNDSGIGECLLRWSNILREIRERRISTVLLNVT